VEKKTYRAQSVKTLFGPQCFEESGFFTLGAFHIRSLGSREPCRVTGIPPLALVSLNILSSSDASYEVCCPLVWLYVSVPCSTIQGGPINKRINVSAIRECSLIGA